MEINASPSEIEKFNRLAQDWWDEEGQSRLLHQINPMRLNFIQNHAKLNQAKILDVGRGGGILSESLAKHGGQVDGIDLAQDAIQIAQQHAQTAGLAIHYRVKPIEAIVQETPAYYDMITCMELLEHVPNPRDLIEQCAAAAKPQGWVFFSTINRTVKAYLSTIVAAEYLLKWLPRGTHDFKSFLKPAELAQFAREAGLEIVEIKGIDYNVVSKAFSLSHKVDVNYLMACRKLG